MAFFFLKNKIINEHRAKVKFVLHHSKNLSFSWARHAQAYHMSFMDYGNTLQ